MRFIERAQPPRILTNQEVKERERERIQAGFPECTACLGLAVWRCPHCGRRICEFHMDTPDVRGRNQCYGCGHRPVERIHTDEEIERRYQDEASQVL